MNAKPELTWKHPEWWICLFLVICLATAFTVLLSDMRHGDSGSDTAPVPFHEGGQ